MREKYEVTVLGATAAGYVAALLLAKKGLEVMVVDAPAARAESPLADWVPADVFAVCPPLKSVRSAAIDDAFRTVHFHSEDLQKSASHKERAAAGYTFRSEQLLAVLDQQAHKARVARLRLDAMPRLDPQESQVVLRSTGGEEIRSSLLLIAQGLPSDVMSDLALPGRNVPGGKASACGLDAPLPARAEAPEGLHLVAYNRGERLGMFFAAGKTVHVRVVSNQADQPAGVDGLSQLISRLQSAGLLPKLELAKATAAIWRPPGGVALELETHLAKRTLLVGTAGGFASALTGQTLDPTVRSALVAAEVAAKALRSRQTQDVLSAYKSQWRDELADRIRPTGTSLQMLMPMVLSNKAMAGRFTRAFLYGQAI